MFAGNSGFPDQSRQGSICSLPASRNFFKQTEKTLKTETGKTQSIDPHALRADFPILSQKVHRNKDLVYFDNGASTQRPVQVLDALEQCYRGYYSNVHRGSHALSLQASEAYDGARERVRQFINARNSSEVIFTSGTTGSINLVAHSFGDKYLSPGDEILLTEMEHHSNIVPWQQLAERKSAQVKFVPINQHGELAFDQLDELLTEKTAIFAFASVSNVLGTINPVAQLVERAHRVGAKVLVDAAQSVPHEPTDVQDSGADFVAFSGHKMLAPSGIGVLYGKQELLEEMPPFLGGGSMISEVTTAGFTPGELPAKFEAGTPPIAQAIGLAAAIDYLEGVGLSAIFEHECELAAALISGLSRIESIRILGPADAQRRAGIVSFVIDGVNSLDFATMIDLKGIAIRNGHHCAMPLHKALGVTESNRASFYCYNTMEEVEYMIEMTDKIVEMLRA